LLVPRDKWKENNMLMWTASWAPAPGKGREAIAWVKETLAAGNQAVRPARPYEVLIEVFGEAGRICAYGGFQDMAQLERWRDWLRTEQVAALAKRSADEGLFVPGSRRDVVQETV
jgi:hypothetical protein